MGDWPDHRVGVTGSRRIKHRGVVAWMRAYWDKHGPVVWVLGGAPGVDTQARELCDEEGWPYVELYAFWSRLGTEAGPSRNREMVAWVLQAARRAFLAFPCTQSFGTWGCRTAARKAGIEVFTNRALTPPKRKEK